MKTSRRAIAPLIVTVLVVVSGCGGSGSASSQTRASSHESLSRKSRRAAIKILLAADDASDAARGFHLSGHMPDGNGHVMTINVRVVDSAGAGTVRANGGVVRMILFGDTSYFHANARFWALGSHHRAHDPRLDGHWLDVSDLPAFAPFLSLAQKDKLLYRVMGPAGVLSRVGTQMYHGVRVVVLGDSAGGSIYVAASIPHLPVAIVGEKHNGTLVFNDWNRPINVKSPPNPLEFLQVGSQSGGL